MALPEVFPVTERIWCVRRRSYLTCSYLVKTDQGTVMIDAGMDSAGRDMRYGLEKAGLAALPLRAILLTHWHNDHAAGAAALAKESGAPVFYHGADAPFLTRATARIGLRGWLGDLIPEWGLLVLFKGLLGEATPHAVTATALVTPGETLLGAFEVLASPGHTPGSVCYLWKPEQALFAGDALAVIGDEIRFMSRPVTPDLSAARASMIGVLSHDLQVICPGHRKPLSQNVAAERARMHQRLTSTSDWQFFG